MERVPETVDLLKAEEEVRSFWRKEQLLRKVMKMREGKPRFRYLEGPPTVNGYMHVGHARGRTIKDVYLRWKSMQGYNAWRQAGWDCQGLPVELEVEKNLQLTSKKDIEDKVGVEKFIALCKELVDSYLEHWRSTSERLGLSLDYDSAYETRRDAYIETGWMTLKRAYEKGMLVEDFKVIPFCPRCETPLSGHEVAQGYGDATDPSVYVKFPLQDGEGKYALIWTTTPWTLLANEAIAVHPDVNYAYIKVGKEEWLIAEPLIEKVTTELKLKDWTVQGKVQGSRLVGLRYNHPFAEEVKAHRSHTSGNQHTILSAEYVTLDEGTGLVHTAPGHGPDDFQLGKKYDLPIFSPVGPDGRYTSEAGTYQGKKVKDSDNEIILELKSKHLLVFETKLEHTYPFCWRCDTPLLYRADLQWFLRADPVRKQMMEENLKVKWSPEWAGRNRFHEWLENAPDWCISRTRYWGTPLNVWTCTKCGQRVVVGSKKELEEKAGNLPSGFELHRPWVDYLQLKCENCGSPLKREAHVLDAWFDSGVAHTAGLTNLQEKPPFDDLFPYEFITEAVDQTRGWFYTLLFTGVLLYGKSPYQSVLCQEHIRDREGSKMSKSKGNTIWAKEVLESAGSDPVRLHLLGVSSPWDAVPYRTEDLELYQRKLRILVNIFSFATTYMILDKYTPSTSHLSNLKRYLTAEDRWILSRTQSTIATVTSKLENHRTDEAVKAILDFAVNDLSREYLRSVKARVWLEEQNQERLAAYSTLYHTLERFLRILAPFAPHLSEWLYQRLAKVENDLGLQSIHLLDWPKPDEEWVNPGLEGEISILQELSAAALNARQKAKLKLRWPVSKVTITPQNEDTFRAATKHHKTLEKTMNTRSVEVLKTGEKNPESILVVKPNLKALGAKYKNRLSQVVQALGQLAPIEVKKALQEQGKIQFPVSTLEEGKVEITSEDVQLEETTPEFYSVAESKSGHVWIDTRRDRELETMALTREIIRRAQSMRKEMGLRVEEYVEVEAVLDDAEDATLLLDKKNYLQEEIRAEKMLIKPLSEKVSLSEADLTRDWEFDGRKLTIKMRRTTPDQIRDTLTR